MTAGRPPLPFLAAALPAAVLLATPLTAQARTGRSLDDGFFWA
jgi:hypothetical protein